MTRLSHKFKSSIKYPQVKALQVQHFVTLCMQGEMLQTSENILQTWLYFREYFDNFYVRLMAESIKNRQFYMHSLFTGNET